MEPLPESTETVSLSLARFSLGHAYRTHIYFSEEYTLGSHG